MTIAQSKLIEIRNSAARADLHPFRVEAADMIAICDELMLSRERFGAVNGGAARDLDEGKLDLGKPSDIEVIAERLAKVEDRLAKVHLYPEHEKAHQAIHQRIDKVAEIIGERVNGLVDELATLRDMFDRAETRTVNMFDRHSTDIASLLHPDEGAKPALRTAFPTGGAYTAEAAAEAVRPVPQRGDRVRLEGATSTGQTHVKDGWYDVTGFHKATDGHDQFQVGTPNGGLYWFYADTSALKEVRHADHT